MRSYTIGGQGRYGSFNPCGYTQTVLSGVTVLIPPAVNIERVLVRAAFGAARFRDDHVNPTGTVGFPVLQDEGMILDSGFDDLRFIKDTTAASCTIEALWYN